MYMAAALGGSLAQIGQKLHQANIMAPTSVGNNLDKSTRNHSCSNYYSVAPELGDLYKIYVLYTGLEAEGVRTKLEFARQ